MTRAIWFARHELRLAWRDFLSMITAGRPGRERIALLIVCGLALGLHLVAWKMMAPYAGITFPPDRGTLVVVTGTAFLAWTAMVSQAMESVTRAFYARSDLDLLLSSPAPTKTIFALRMMAIMVSIFGLAVVLTAPFISVLVLAGGPRWLGAYGVLLAMAAAAAALAVGLTLLLFAALGPKRTRFIAQVVAAVVGAAFVIGIQIFSIITYGSLSRVAAFHSHWALAMAPDDDSLFWLPAHAAMGDRSALVIVLVLGFTLFGLAASAASKRFGMLAVATAGIAMAGARQKRRTAFHHFSAPAALRRKEWMLLLRDPWLASQTLMQVLYLIPPALLLWRNYGAGAGALVVLVPALVMAAGQLAGGLAWLAISGEDAPDLVATAPVRPHAVLRAKIEAVIGAVAFVLAPLVLALAIPSPQAAFVTTVGVLAAAASATAIQLFFRAQAKRSYFRRRQTSSRVATFAEAFSSIGWAAAAGLAVAGSFLAMLAATASVLVVALAGVFRSGRSEGSRPLPALARQ